MESDGTSHESPVGSWWWWSSGLFLVPLMLSSFHAVRDINCKYVLVCNSRGHAIYTSLGL